MSVANRIAFLAAAYCVVGMAVASFSLIRLGSLEKHLTMEIQLGVLASVVTAWFCGRVAAPWFQRKNQVLWATGLGTATAYLSLLIGGVVSAVLVRIPEDGTTWAENWGHLWLSIWTVSKIMLLFGWFPALILGAVFGYHIRIWLHSPKRNASAPTPPSAR